MALTELVFQSPTPAEIGSLTLDASVRELHQASAKVTRHPIEAEEGSPQTVSDHINVDPLSINIQGVISGHPAEIAAGIVNLFAGGAKDPVRDAHQTLLDDLLTGRLVTVFTTLLEYPNMVLEKVSVTRDAPTGNSLHFNAVATQITFATTETVEVAPQRRTKKGGKKAKEEANDTELETARSAAALAADWYGGL
jgi:hypothetical protein